MYRVVPETKIVNCVGWFCYADRSSCLLTLVGEHTCVHIITHTLRQHFVLFASEDMKILTKMPIIPLVWYNPAFKLHITNLNPQYKIALLHQSYTLWSHLTSTILRETVRNYTSTGAIDISCRRNLKSTCSMWQL